MLYKAIDELTIKRTKFARNKNNKIVSNQKQLSAQFNFVCSALNRSLIDLTDEESNTRPHKDANHIKYIAGHLVNAMYGIGGSIGVNLERRWDDIFAGGGRTKALDDFKYPTIDELKTEWNKICPLIQVRLDKLTEQDLNKVMPNSFLVNTGIFDGTVGDFLAFFNQHQLYHIGQIGIIRKILGKAPMSMF